MKVWKLYTDGSCETATGAGGWGYLLCNEYGFWEGFGSSPMKATAQQMEFCALLAGLMAVPDGAQVKVYTDCRAGVEILNNLVAYEARNFKKANGKKIPDAWLIHLVVDEMTRLGKVQFGWVARCVNFEMRKADFLAKEGRLLHKGVLAA